MARMPLVRAEEMTPEQRAIAEAIAGRRSGVIRGPWAQIIRNPALARVASAYGDFLRGETSVPPRLAMIAVLITARHWKAEYMWAAQGPRARESGLSEAIIESLRKGERPIFEDERDGAVYDLIVELYKYQQISDTTYEGAENAMGRTALVELLNIAGFYTTLAMVIAATGVPTIEGAAPAFA